MAKRHRNARQHPTPARLVTSRALERHLRPRPPDRDTYIVCDVCGRAMGRDRTGWVRVPLRPFGAGERHVCCTACWDRLVEGDASARPRTRAECVNGPRPCPWVGCKYHLYLDVIDEPGPDGERRQAIKLNWPDVPVDEMRESCALDVAARGEHGPEQLANLLNLTRERMRLVYNEAIDKIAADMEPFREWFGEEDRDDDARDRCRSVRTEDDDAGSRPAAPAA